MDFLTEYIQKIKSNEITVSKKIKQFYLKIIEPIVNDQSEKYYYDPNKGLMFIEFAENFCKQSNGKWHNKYIQLMLFQKAKYQALLGILDRQTNKRRFKEVFDVRGRKNGKSQENAIFATYMTLFSKGIEVYVAATTFAQASRIWDETRFIIEKNTYLNKRFSSKVFPSKTITNNATKSQFKVLSKNTDSQDGLNVSVAIIDEVHQLSREVYDLLKQATSAQEQPILSMITTAGFVRGGLFDDTYEYASKVLDGTVEDDTLMPLIYEQDEAEEISHPELWIKSNPAIDIIKSSDFIKTELERMKTDLNLANTVKVKDFNVIGVENSVWLSYEDFNNDKVYDLSTFDNSICIGGFDLSRTGDMTAFTTLLFDKVNKKVIADTMYWVTAQFLREQEQQNSKVPWRAWLDRGLVRISGDNIIDYHDISNYVSHNFHTHGYTYVKINYDSYSAQYLVQELELMGYMKDYCLVATPQGAKTLSVPMQTLEAHLKNKTISYQNNPITKWCLSNVELEQDRNGNYMPKKVKDKRNRKIDGVATILNCYVSLCENIDYYLGE